MASLDIKICFTYLQTPLTASDIKFVELPEIGKIVDSDAAPRLIGKATSDIYSTVTGPMNEIKDALLNETNWRKKRDGNWLLLTSPLLPSII